MSTESCLIDRQPLEECLEQGRSARDRFAESWSESLDALADLRANLESWQRDLSKEHVQLERVRSIFEEEKQAYFAETVAKENAKKVLREQIETTKAERDQLREKLGLALASLDTLEEVQAENEKLRTQACRMQDELGSSDKVIEELRAELQIVRTRSTEANDEHNRIQDVIQELDDAHNAATKQQHQADAAQEQCEALETELETVRNRVVELSDTLSRERHQMASDRAEWANELKRLRQQAEDQAAAEHNMAQPAVEIVNDSSLPRASSKVVASSDVVVGSVLAQFDKIRQQRTRRRTHK